MIAGWEIIARLSAQIPLPLHHRPRYSPRFKITFHFDTLESFLIKIEISTYMKSSSIILNAPFASALKLLAVLGTRS